MCTKMVEFEHKQLYGGAITVDIPTGVLDASNFRQIPDTQEVFVANSDNVDNYAQLNKDDSIIVDLMERVEARDDQEAIRVHYSEISALNDASNEWHLVSVEEAGAKQRYVAVGVEPALKWGRAEVPEGAETTSGDSASYKPTLVVVLGVIRLDKVDTDLLITYNVHISREDELADLAQVSAEQWKTLGAPTRNRALQRVQLGQQVVQEMVNSLAVADWGLFG